MSPPELPELPTLPKPVEPKRAEPLERYMTQQLTRAVPQAGEPVTETERPWIARARTRVAAIATAVSTRVARISRRNRLLIGLGAAFVVLVLLSVTAGDGSATAVASDDGIDGTEQAEGGGWIDAQLATWSAAGLAPGGFADIDPGPLGASQCQGGAASAIEITLCEFATPAASREARPSAEKTIGKSTGVVLADDERLLIIVDRRAADPTGKTINRLANAFGRRRR